MKLDLEKIIKKPFHKSKNLLIQPIQNNQELFIVSHNQNVKHYHKV
jgi:hypothetical protein